MILLSEKETKELLEIPRLYKYIAREHFGTTYVYIEKPYKDGIWKGIGREHIETSLELDSNRFYEIDQLLKEVNVSIYNYDIEYLKTFAQALQKEEITMFDLKNSLAMYQKGMLQAKRIIEEALRNESIRTTNFK